MALRATPLIWCLVLYFCTGVPLTAADLVNGSTRLQEPDTLKIPPPNVCLSDICNRTAEQILNSIDKDVNPCDNFYKFACGQFLRKTIVPDDVVTSVDSFSKLRDSVQLQLKEILEEEIHLDEKKSFKLAKNFYKGCSDDDAIEKNGLKPLQDILKKLGGWPALEGDNWIEANFTWMETVYRMNDLGIGSFLLSLGVNRDQKNSSRRVLTLSRPFSILPRNYTHLLAYHDYVVDIAAILGGNRDRVAREVMDALLFEMFLTHMSPLKFDHTPMTITELTQKYPNIPWMEYVQRQLPESLVVDENEVIVVNEPNYIFNFEQLMNQSTKRVQANYLMYRAVLYVAHALSKNIRDIELKYSKAVYGKSMRIDRWKQCMIMTTSFMPLSVYALYIRKHFSKDTKEKVVEMVDDLKKQFREILQNADWMENKTRERGLEKLDAMTSLIGYTDDLMDDKILEEIVDGLEVDKNEYFYAFLNVSRFNRASIFKKLRASTANESLSQFHGADSFTSVFYNILRNAFVLPAPILQGKFFHSERPKYMNYGAIGFIIAHEITHGFDINSGGHYDKNGNLADWQDTVTEAKFIVKTKCIVDQYGNYTDEEVGLKVNSMLTYSENIADNGGIKTAYFAYKDWVRRNNASEPTLPNLPYSPTQMFWISTATSWCTKYRKEYLRVVITEEEHGSSESRIVGALSNMPDFAQDFQCPVGSKMNPATKCTVW